ncbi:GntR family transcriptional regulator [Jatrophihabitans sp. YIM 134969]
MEVVVIEAGKGDTPRLRTVVTVQHATLTWLREQIATGVLKAGDQVRQEVLAREFGVSVPPMREALRTLEAEGQLVYAPHRGYFVASMSYDELAETYRIRQLLETEAITRSVPGLGREDVTRMREAVSAMERHHRTADVRAIAEANRVFHFTLFDAAAMPRMADMIRVLWSTTDRYRSLYFATAEHRLRVNTEHRAILAATRAGDSALVVELSHQHRLRSLDALARTFEAETSSAPSSSHG